MRRFTAEQLIEYASSKPHGHIVRCSPGPIIADANVIALAYHTLHGVYVLSIAVEDGEGEFDADVFCLARHNVTDHLAHYAQPFIDAVEYLNGITENYETDGYFYIDENWQHTDHIPKTLHIESKEQGKTGKAAVAQVMAASKQFPNACIRCCRPMFDDAPSHSHIVDVPICSECAQEESLSTEVLHPLEWAYIRHAWKGRTYLLGQMVTVDGDDKKWKCIAVRQYYGTPLFLMEQQDGYGRRAIMNRYGGIELDNVNGWEDLNRLHELPLIEL